MGEEYIGYQRGREYQENLQGVCTSLSMRFFIPSSGREGELKTVNLLRRLHLDDSCTVFVQTPEDFDAYKERGIGNIHYARARNLAGNLNNILDTLDDGEFAVILDDDLTNVSTFVPREENKCGFGAEALDGEEFLRELEALIDACSELDADAAFAYPIDNIPFMVEEARKHGPFQARVIGGSPINVVWRGSFRYDETFDFKEDIELQLRIISCGGTVLRDNRLCPTTVSRSVSEFNVIGGRGSRYGEDPREIWAAERLLATYGFMVRRSGKNSFRLRG